MKKWKCLIVVLALAGLSACGNEQASTVNIDKAMKSVEAADYETALEQFKTAEEKGEDPLLLYRGEGITYMSMGDYATAIDKFKQALQYGSHKITEVECDITYYLAAAQFKSGDAPAAIQTYTNLLKVKKNNDDAYYMRGVAYLSLGNVKDAREDFDKAISLKSDNYQRYINIFNACNEHEQAEVGRAYLENVLKTMPKDKHYERGLFYYYLENYESAKSELTQAVSNGKNEAVLYLGKTHQALGDMDYAAQLYQQYIGVVADDGDAYNQLGLCKLVSGDYEGALTSFQNGIKTGDGAWMQDLMFNEIIAYEYLADFVKAKEKMQTYLSAYPDDAEALQEYEFLKTR